jgi:hypothetical protein
MRMLHAASRCGTVFPHHCRDLRRVREDDRLARGLSRQPPAVKQFGEQRLQQQLTHSVRELAFVTHAQPALKDWLQDSYYRCIPCGLEQDALADLDGLCLQLTEARGLPPRSEVSKTNPRSAHRTSDARTNAQRGEKPNLGLGQFIDIIRAVVGARAPMCQTRAWRFVVRDFLADFLKRRMKSQLDTLIHPSPPRMLGHLASGTLFRTHPTDVGCVAHDAVFLAHPVSVASGNGSRSLVPSSRPSRARTSGTARIQARTFASQPRNKVFEDVRSRIKNKNPTVGIVNPRFPTVPSVAVGQPCQSQGCHEGRS